MIATFTHELLDIVTVHWNNDLLSWQTFGSYINVWFGFITSLDDFLNIVDFTCFQRWKGILDFENFLSVANLFWDLGIQFGQNIIDWRCLQILEVFRDFLYFIGWFGGDWEWKSLDTCWNCLGFIPFISIVYRLSFQGAFKRNLLSEGILVTVSMERILSWWINWHKKIPCCFTNILKVFNIIGLIYIDTLVINILD